jgi:HK97 family phage major capsid protein
MLKQVRVERPDGLKGERDKINVGAPVTESAAEDADTGNIYEPTFSKVEFDCKKLRSAFNVTWEANKNNIEKEKLKDTLMASFAKRISTDLELLAVQGDTTITGTDPLSRLLKRCNGWNKQITDANLHIVNASDAVISRSLFSKAIRILPNKYKQALNQFKWFLSPSTYQDYVDTLANLTTPLGDSATQTQVRPAPFGIPAEQVPAIPEVWDAGAGYYRTYALLVIPANLIWFIAREIETYWEFKPRNDRWENTTYTNADARVENLDAVVKIKDIKIVP